MDSQNPCDTGLLINGDNVTGYGLAVEHTLGNMLEWNGENGESYFFQSEYPYDVTQDNYGDKGFAAYKVGDDVQNHKSWGAGVYSFFRDHAVIVESGIQTPQDREIEFTNALTVFLNGMGQINHVINNVGDLVKTGQQLSYQCSWTDQPDRFLTE